MANDAHQRPVQMSIFEHQCEVGIRVQRLLSQRWILVQMQMSVKLELKLQNMVACREKYYLNEQYFCTSLAPVVWLIAILFVDIRAS